MDVSLYSLLMSILWSSIFILLLFVCRRSNRFILYIGVVPLVLLISGSILRCFFPFDFPIFTKVIPNDGLLARINFFLKKPFNATQITPLLLLGGVWITVFVVLFTRFLAGYKQYIKKIDSYVEIDSPQIIKISETIAKAFKTRGLRIYQTSNTRVPLIVGFLKPRILLPVFDYSDTDFKYIFTHELTHWKNHDLWVKLLIEVISDFFWWNPLVYLLKRDLSQTLEIKCDLSVVGSKNTEQRYEYLETIKKTIRFNPSYNEISTFPYTISELSGVNECEVIQRTKIILDYKAKPFLSKVMLGAVVGVAVILFVFSYSFIFQPSYEAPENEITGSGHTEMTPNNTYIYKEANGILWLYFDGKKTKQINSDIAEMMVESGFVVKKDGGNINE